jgi:two-component system, cell cycle response regulator DivK
MLTPEATATRQVILIADDKENSRELVRAILERANYVVVEAANGEEALLMASESNPQLVILDIHMPKRDGFGVVKEMRTNPALQTIPIMALTATASLNEESRILDSGFDACLVKPIGPAKLRDAVASLLLQSHSTT